MSRAVLKALVENPETLCCLSVRPKNSTLKATASEFCSFIERHGPSSYSSSTYRAINTFANLSALAKRLSESSEYKSYTFYICPLVPLEIEVNISIEVNSFK